MTVLFKYLRKEYANLLVTNGRLRIGTLYEYQDTEKHGNVIGDDNEGKKSLYMNVTDEEWTKDNVPSFVKQFFSITESGSLRMRNSSFVIPYFSPNFYIYCTTGECDRGALREFGYDSCVVIENPKEFFAAITRALKHKATFSGVYPCEYVPRDVPYDRDHGVHPALIKDPRFTYQKEVRALWQPLEENISPLVIDCPEVSTYCRLLGKLENPTNTTANGVSRPRILAVEVANLFRVSRIK